MDDGEALKARRAELDAGLAREEALYFRLAHVNYYGQQVFVWGSLVASAAAALLGLLPSNAPKAWVGLLAAASVALVGASRQLGLQEKANWHYRKTDALIALRRRLAFELPLSPTADDLAAISKAWSDLDSNMTKQWEDLQTAAKAKRASA